MNYCRRYHVRRAQMGDNETRFAVWDTSRPKWSCVKIFDTEQEAQTFVAYCDRVVSGDPTSSETPVGIL